MHCGTIIIIYILNTIPIIYSQNAITLCGWPGKINYGNYHIDGNFTVYECETPYTLVGPAKRECKNMEWDPQIPFCVPNLGYFNKITLPVNISGPIYWFNVNLTLQAIRNYSHSLVAAAAAAPSSEKRFKMLHIYIKPILKRLGYINFIYDEFNCLVCSPEIAVSLHGLYYICYYNVQSQHCYIGINIPNHAFNAQDTINLPLTLVIFDPMQITCGVPDTPPNCNLHKMGPGVYLLEPKLHYILEHYDKPPIIVCQNGIWYPRIIGRCIRYKVLHNYPLHITNWWYIIFIITSIVVVMFVGCVLRFLLYIYLYRYKQSPAQKNIQ